MRLVYEKHSEWTNNVLPGAAGHQRDRQPVQSAVKMVPVCCSEPSTAPLTVIITTSCVMQSPVLAQLCNQHIH